MLHACLTDHTSCGQQSVLILFSFVPSVRVKKYSHRNPPITAPKDHTTSRARRYRLFEENKEPPLPVFFRSPMFRSWIADLPGSNGFCRRRFVHVFLKLLGSHRNSASRSLLCRAHHPVEGRSFFRPGQKRAGGSALARAPWRRHPEPVLLRRRSRSEGKVPRRERGLLRW